MVWCLGDVVGYGPNPNECVELLSGLRHVSLSGNHDWAVLGRLDLAMFEHSARQAAQWTASVLNESSRAYLETLPPLLHLDEFTLVHASPRRPVWEYVVEPQTAAAVFDAFSTPCCLIGHSHIAIYFLEDEDEGAVGYLGWPDTALSLSSPRVIANPGSVGQPRDHDPRAAYALLDTETRTLEYRRVGYPIELTQEQMRAVGLPERLIGRLALGW
jgi:diadenosine tetraphosphatase ApaH/serine/threonine PP2A family protein phosphatase